MDDDTMKVIKGVHDARRYLEDREWVDKSVGVHIDALNDALALLKEQEEEIENLKQTAQSMMEGICLLKEQEAVKPIFVTGEGAFFCGSCKFPLGVSGVNYCPGCGKAVKWT